MAGPQKTITISELRERLPEIVHRTLAFGETYYVTKYNQPFARLTPIEDEGELERVKQLLLGSPDEVVISEEEPVPRET